MNKIINKIIRYILYDHIYVSFDGSYKNGEKVIICYNFYAKRNFTYLFTIYSTGLVRCINHFIQDIFSKCVIKEIMYEGKDIRRLINEDELDALNNTLNGAIHTWLPPKVKVKDLKITNLI